MRRIGLLVVGGVLCLTLAVSQFGRGAPSPCGSCDCATADAWGRTDQGGVVVLTTVIEGQEEAFGEVLTDARWQARAPEVIFWVYAPSCLMDYHDLSTNPIGSGRRWSIPSLNSDCQLGGSQTNGGYIAKTYAASTNYSPVGLYSQYDCGPQD